MSRNIYTLLLMAVIMTTLGCSGSTGQIPMTPENEAAAATYGSHMSWGLSQFIADPQKETLDVIPLRGAEFHLNALAFLEPPALVYLSLESLDFNGNMIETDIGLRHPFLGLDEFTGFDVYGILITNGSLTGFTDTDIRYAGPGDTRLLNPDGHTRWWNPTDFPANSSAPISGYIDGLLGAPDSFGEYNSTLNGYKYFCDSLDDPNDPLSDVALASRGMFSAGQKNVRHYSIELGTDGLVFNYAIDACWQFPDGDPPWQAPDDFLIEANQVEPWYIAVEETDNTLYYEDGDAGGELHLTVDVYDWANAETNMLYIEAADGIIPMVGPLTPSGGDMGYSTYTVDITDAYPTTAGDLDLLITIETEQEDFQGFITGTNTSAYFIHTTDVADEAPSNPEDPVIIDDNGCFGTAIGVDENGVIHTAYVDQGNLFWSYSTNQGSTWTNLDDVYNVTTDLLITSTSLSMYPGPDDGYMYVAWSERAPAPSLHRALWAGRMPTNLTESFDAVMVWEHTTGNSVQGYDSTQILALDNGEFLIYSMFYYQSGGGFRPVYNRVANFAALEGCTELVVNDYLSGGYLVYIYTGTTQELDADSNGNAYFLNSGRFNSPAYSRGSFVLQNQAGGNWNFFDYYIPTASVYDTWYWDNRSNGLCVDDSDVIHLVSQWQTVDDPGSMPPADDEGYYTMIYAEGPANGSLTWTDPIPNMTRGIPHGSAYYNARYDYEWQATSCVEDGSGLTYIVFQDCVNRRDAYYITYDGTDWNHTASSADWVKINTTTDQNAYLPYAIKGLNGYIYVTYTDMDGTDPGVPVFKAFKDE